MNVSDVMSRVVVSVTPNEDLARVRNIFLKYGITKIPVLEGDVLVGGITEMQVAAAYLNTQGPIEATRVSDVMTDKIISVSPADNIDDVIDKVIGQDLVVVMSGGNLDGILYKSDLIQAVRSRVVDKPISDMMTRNPVTVRPEQSIFRAIKDMKEKKVKHLPVIKEGNIVGIVSAKDIALSTFGLRPKKLTFIRRSSEGPRKVIRIVPQTVGGIMRTPVETLPGNASVKKAISRLINRGVGSIVVYDKKKLEGILTKTDVLSSVKS